MNNRSYCRKINDTLVFYDSKHDIIKFSDDEYIMDNYSKERLAKVAPYETDIQVTTKCNQQCINCFLRTGTHNQGLEMSYPVIRQYINERKDSKIRILITGGEPFLHSDIDKILELPGIFEELNFVICSNAPA